MNRTRRATDADMEMSLRDYAEGRFKRGSIDDLLADLHATEQDKGVDG